jgi:predicted dehydrogenase
MDYSERPLRGALIGCGFVSRYHLEGWSKIADVRLAALCDLNSEALEGAAARVPEANRYADAAEMFRDEAEAGTPLDFVEICTRPESHRGLVELAASHGVHVLCQKPAAPSRADLEAMIHAGERAGVRVMIHENWRFRPWYRALRAEIESGAVGRPIRLRIAHRDTRAIRPGGFADQPYFTTMPRLILYEMGCHLIDTARSLMGEIADVTARLGRFGLENPGEDVATLLVGFAGGAMGLIDITWCAPADHARAEWALNDTVVEGTEATLRLRLDGALDRIDVNGRCDRIAVNLPAAEDVYVEGYTATQRHFLDGLRTGRAHETSAAETLRTMDVVWRAYESAEVGKSLAV